MPQLKASRSEEQQIKITYLTAQKQFLDKDFAVLKQERDQLKAKNNEKRRKIKDITDKLKQKDDRINRLTQELGERDSTIDREKAALKQHISQLLRYAETIGDTFKKKEGVQKKSFKRTRQGI